jgi:hypothetical protein
MHLRKHNLYLLMQKASSALVHLHSRCWTPPGGRYRQWCIMAQERDVTLCTKNLSCNAAHHHGTDHAPWHDQHLCTHRVQHCWIWSIRVKPTTEIRHAACRGAQLPSYISLASSSADAAASLPFVLVVVGSFLALSPMGSKRKANAPVRWRPCAEAELTAAATLGASLLGGGRCSCLVSDSLNLRRSCLFSSWWE